MVVLYVRIKELPYKYRIVLEELKEAGFDVTGLLEGYYDSYEIFESSKALREIAVEKIVDELVFYAINKPNDYIDSNGNFGYTIVVHEFVDDFLDRLRKYYKRIEERGDD